MPILIVILRRYRTQRASPRLARSVAYKEQAIIYLLHNRVLIF